MDSNNKEVVEFDADKCIQNINITLPIVYHMFQALSLLQHQCSSHVRAHLWQLINRSTISLIIPVYLSVRSILTLIRLDLRAPSLRGNLIAWNNSLYTHMSFLPYFQQEELELECLTAFRHPFQHCSCFDRKAFLHLSSSLVDNNATFPYHAVFG